MEFFSSYPFIVIGFFALTIFGILILILVNKSDHIHRLKNALEEMKESFEELDEQAKLIVKTDLELNKTQEELDKRLDGLDALQKISRQISTTLDENEVFHRLKQAVFTELGFEKILILSAKKDQTYLPRVVSGFSDEHIKYILDNLAKDPDLTLELAEGRTFSSVNTSRQHREFIAEMFDAEHFVLSPIVTKNGMLGCLFAGNRSNTAPINDGDEELISILANQIGQTLENAALYEEVFRSSQMLELKVQERTQQLASALEEVKNINKTKSEFISAVSHELRTPLTSIKGYAAILMTGKLGEIPAEVKERLQKINTHSDNLVQLINDLLDISRIESGRVEMSMSNCPIADMVDGVHDLLTPQLTAKHIHWSQQIENNLPAPRVDRSQIDRVFINLIGNAIKFTPEQGKISVTAKREDNHILVTVSDTGIGISQEDSVKLFDEFYRVENQINQNVKGTGLGLALVKKIVEAHHGTIWVTSKINEGTNFHFTLPLNQEQ